MSGVLPAQAIGDELSFTTTALNPALLGTVRMRLYVDADGGTAETGLTVECQAIGQPAIVRRMLDSTVDSLKVEYLDSRTGKWFGSKEAATIAPIAVRLTLHSSDSTASPLIRVPMMFTIGNPWSANFRRPGQ